MGSEYYSICMADREHQEWLANRKARKDDRKKAKPEPLRPTDEGGPRAGGSALAGGGIERDDFDPVLW